jgi:hypothetical protein
MRFAGIDVGAERHMVAMVGEDGEVLCRSSPSIAIPAELTYPNRRRGPNQVAVKTKPRSEIGAAETSR